MVSSTVYGFERDLQVICATIESYSVRYARELLAQFMYTDRKNRVRKPDFEFETPGAT